MVIFSLSTFKSSNGLPCWVSFLKTGHMSLLGKAIAVAVEASGPKGPAWLTRHSALFKRDVPCENRGREDRRLIA
jgi:hypothetical protein